MRLGVRHKLIILGTLVILVVSSGFTWLNLALARRTIEEDLKARAIVYAREIAATLGQGSDLGSRPALQHLIGRLIEIRTSVLQLDVLAFRPDGTTVVATNLPDTRVPFTEADHAEARGGGIILRPVTRGAERYWEVMAPITLDGSVAGAVAVRRTDEFGVLARHFNEMVARIRRFNDELKTRIGDATGELDQRYHELEQLNTLLFEMQRRLGRAERLALPGRVMAEVAHEVGTPLHSVAGHLELLRKDLPPAVMTDDVARRLTIIETQVTRVIDIITRLLDVTRHASGEPAPVDLERLARDTADLVRPALMSAGVTLDVRGEPHLPRVHGRSDQLQQVILNLLTNAIDATPPGGRIDVITRRPAGHGEVEIAVADTGRGIAPAVREKIFEPFFSTKEPGRGTGLGLFISAEIVREHKGRIDIDSVEGRGSTFRVFLPGVERTA